MRQAGATVIASDFMGLESDCGRLPFGEYILKKLCHRYFTAFYPQTRFPRNVCCLAKVPVQMYQLLTTGSRFQCFCQKPIKADTIWLLRKMIVAIVILFEGVPRAESGSCSDSLGLSHPGGRGCFMYFFTCQPVFLYGLGVSHAVYANL